MFNILLLGSLLLVHQEGHGWGSKLAIKQDPKEVFSVLIWVLRLDVLALEHIN